MGRAEDNKRDKLERILPAGRELLRTRGFAGTSMDDVAARAGVSKGAVYFHVGSKAALLNRVFQVDMGTWIEQSFAAPPEGDVLEDLVRCYAGLLRAMCAHPELTRVYMSQVAFAQDEHERADETVELLLARTGAIIDRAKQRNEIEADVATDRLASNLFARTSSSNSAGSEERTASPTTSRDGSATCSQRKLVPLLQPGPTRDTARRSARQSRRRPVANAG